MDPSPDDRFDPDALRLPTGMAGGVAPRMRPPRHPPGGRFPPGPIPFAWWAAACRLPGASPAVASAICFEAGLRRRREGLALGLADLDRMMGVKRDTARRALRMLAGTGLISASRPDGCKPEIALL